jgi:hypothetical protein
MVVLMTAFFTVHPPTTIRHPLPPGHKRHQANCNMVVENVTMSSRRHGLSEQTLEATISPIREKSCPEAAVATFGNPDSPEVRGTYDDFRAQENALSGPTALDNVRKTSVISTLCLSTFLFTYDNFVVANVRPQIIDTLGEINKLPILSVAYSVAAASTVLLWTQLLRQWNQRWLYCGACVLFMLGSAVCGAAPSMDSLIAARVLCGSGT